MTFFAHHATTFLIQQQILPPILSSFSRWLPKKRLEAMDFVHPRYTITEASVVGVYW